MRHLKTVNFMYFICNYPYKFIDSVWSDEPMLVNHLTIKFGSFCERHGSMGGFVNWFMELDRTNQTKLLNWVEDNYKGISA